MVCSSSWFPKTLLTKPVTLTRRHHGHLNAQWHSGGQSPSASTRSLHLIHVHIADNRRHSVRRLFTTANRRRSWRLDRRAGRPTSANVWRQSVDATRVSAVEWFAMFVLCFVNLINYMDRFTIAGKLHTRRSKKVEEKTCCCWSISGFVLERGILIEITCGNVFHYSNVQWKPFITLNNNFKFETVKEQSRSHWFDLYLRLWDWNYGGFTVNGWWEWFFGLKNNS